MGLRFRSGFLGKMLLLVVMIGLMVWDLGKKRLSVNGVGIGAGFRFWLRKVAGWRKLKDGMRDKRRLLPFGIWGRAA